MRKLYRETNVTLKRIKYRNSWRRDDDAKGQAKDLEIFADLKEAIAEVEAGDHELVMADECLFNQRHVIKNTWSNRYVNVHPKIMLKN